MKSLERSIEDLKLRSGTKIGVGGAIVLAGAWLGWDRYSAWQVDNIAFQPLKPKQVNLIGMKTGSGYKIIVANNIAQLVQLSNADDFETAAIDDTVESGVDATNKRRVPLEEMLESLGGDEKALGYLVKALNESLAKMELPAIEVIWDAADLRKAIEDKDPVLLKKLEQDLNVRLDGTPLPEIRPKSLENGIVIRAYVPVLVNVVGSQKTLKAPIYTPFQPRFASDVRKAYEKEFNPTHEKIMGRYLDLAQKLKDRPGDKQNVARDLMNRIDERQLQSLYAEAPERVLGNAFVVATEDQIESASVNEVAGTNGAKVSDIRLNVTDEGRKRLWQYSRKHQGQQLLFIQNGVAIAAPRIRQHLAGSDVTIRHVQDNALARETVSLINELKKNPS